MKDTLELRCLVESLSYLLEAESNERKARDEYHGPSWGYFGQSLIEAREHAAEAFGVRLNDYIDKRIQAATGVRP